MFTPLMKITIDSIYDHGPLPARMAHCTPDTFVGTFAIQKELRDAGTNLVLSDMFRSFEMQSEAHQDFVTHKKTANSPPPGGSMHEAGRAFDLDVDRIKAMGLKAFWAIAARHGFTPILDKPDIGANEAWHFDCRGSHQLVYDYYKAGKGGNSKSPYAAMAASGIVSIGVKVEAFGEDPKPAYVQSGLIRLGKTIGGMDGDLGTKSKTALGELGIDAGQPIDAIAAAIDAKLQEKFPDEFATPDAPLVA